MNKDLIRNIIEFLERHPDRAYKTKELARAMHLSRQGHVYQGLKAALRELQHTDKIARVDGRKWALKPTSDVLTGELHRTPDGFGIRLAGSPGREIHIRGKHLNGAREGDSVRFMTLPGRHRREEGQVLEVLSGKKRSIVGTLKNLTGKYFVETDSRHDGPDVRIGKGGLNGAKDGDKVVIELKPVDEKSFTREGSVLEVLGSEGDPAAEMLALARRYDLSPEFPDQVEDEAAEAPVEIPAGELGKRLDLRDEVCFTIDPENARDYDDAVSLSMDEDGNYLLGVHIADVSHYVPSGSALDTEAARRGTSVYLVDGVIPMLPERLSNFLCSLKEDSDRLTFSVLMTVTPRGSVSSCQFRKSVIHSRRRFSYEEVQEILEKGEGEFSEKIDLMNRLAQVLMKKRFREGAIDFSVPEVGFVLDERGYPLEIRAKQRLQSMRIIEEFMLLANRMVAQSIMRKGGRGGSPPFIYRVHDLPDPEKVSELIEFLQHLGVRVRLDPKSSRSFMDMLGSVKGTLEEPVIHDVTIRSMAKAIYDEKNIGHFGLGFKAYTHFTSPIRRYPDLIVHRLVERLLTSDKRSRSGYEAGKLHDIAQHSSAMERRAVEAERESIKLKQIEYLERHLGDTFDAVISGVTSYGLYVKLIPILVEGLVHIRHLDGYYTYDKRKRALVGRSRKQRYRLGDRVRVQVSRVDLADKQIDFLILDE